MNLFADVTLAADSLAVVAAVVAALVAAVVAQWRLDVRRRDDQIADLRHQRDELLHVLLRSDKSDEVPASVPHSAIPPTRPPGE